MMRRVDPIISLGLSWLRFFAGSVTLALLEVVLLLVVVSGVRLGTGDGEVESCCGV